jgi:hypothetical protein
VDFKLSFSFCREHTSVLQNLASVMICVRQHETNSRWLMELLGQIENAVNKKADSDNQQVSTVTVMATQQMPPINFKSQILKTRVNTHACTHRKLYSRAVHCRSKVTLMFNYTFLSWITYFFFSVVSYLFFSIIICMLFPYSVFQFIHAPSDLMISDKKNKLKIGECSNNLIFAYQIHLILSLNIADISPLCFLLGNLEAYTGYSKSWYNEYCFNKNIMLLGN